MILFNELAIRDFGPIQEAMIPLTKQGLVLISGENKDTAAATSNGSGKSHLFKALGWALFGKTIDRDESDVVRNGAANAVVAVSWTDGKSTWVLERKKGKGAKLILTQDGHDISGTIPETEAEVIRILGLDWQTWRNTVLYGQGDTVRFADNTSSDSDRKAILKRILRMEVLDKALKVAREASAGKGREVAERRARAQVIQARMDELAADEALSQQVPQLEAEIKEAEKAARRASKIKPILKQAKVHLEDMNEKLREMQDKERTEQIRVQTEAAKLKAEASSLDRDAARAAAALNQLKGGACPTCGAPADSKHVKGKQAELQAEYTRCSEGAADARESATLMLREAVARDELADVKTYQTSVESWQKDVTRLTAEEATANSAAKRAVSLKSQLQGILHKLSNDRNKFEQLETELAALNAEADALETEARHTDFWAKGFSNQGLPSHLMDSIAPQLADRANHYLEILTDGDIRVKMDTQTAIKTGELRDKFSISWVIEGQNGTTPSGGQRKKIAIAVDLALMDLVAAREKASIDLLMLDEVLDGLDEAGKSRIIDLLQELRKSRGTIMVVSHDPALAQMFERQILVTKEDGIARVE